MSLFTEEGSKLISEYINLLIAFAVIDLIRNLLIAGAIVVLIKKLKKAEDIMKEDKDALNILNPLRVIAVGTLLLFVFTSGFSSAKELVKIGVAPRVYLVEKGAHLIKPNTTKAVEK